MKVYLDNCALQRPLDDRSQFRIVMEAEAIITILSYVEAGKIELVASEVLEFEIANNPRIARREYGQEVLKRAGSRIEINDEIEDLAKLFESSGIKPLDALHLASAENTKVDFFCTCDDRFLSRAKKLESIAVKVVSPIELIEELEK